MPTLNPYLNFAGNTEEAFNFYKSIFGGEFIGGIKRFKDFPGSEKMSEDDANKIMHVALPIGKDHVIMATDALESMGQKLIQGNNFHISINTDTKDEADSLFAKLSEGGKIELPIQETFWGAYFGMLEDKFRIQWMINLDKK